MSACTIVDPARATPETIRYLDLAGGEQLYTVLHHARGESRGSLLLCGPINAERERGLRSIVDLARSLAADGYDVMRFDYRGIGESTGAFDERCLSDWREDIRACATALRAIAPRAPLSLWGLRAGALLVSELFAAGLGDAAMCCAPMDGQPLLQDILRRTLVADMMARPHAKRTTREEIVAALERGEFAVVDGYRWSRRLWEDAAAHRFTAPADLGRPWRVVDFRGLPKSSLPAALESCRDTETSERFWESTPQLVPKSQSLLDRMRTWLRGAHLGGGS